MASAKKRLPTLLLPSRCFFGQPRRKWETGNLSPPSSPYCDCSKSFGSQSCSSLCSSRASRGFWRVSVSTWDQEASAERAPDQWEALTQLDSPIARKGWAYERSTCRVYVTQVGMDALMPDQIAPCELIAGLGVIISLNTSSLLGRLHGKWKLRISDPFRDSLPYDGRRGPFFKR